MPKRIAFYAVAVLTMSGILPMALAALQIWLTDVYVNPAKLACKAGVSVDSVRKYLRGEMVPTLETTYKLAAALGCTPNDLCAFDSIKEVRK